MRKRRKIKVKHLLFPKKRKRNLKLKRKLKQRKKKKRLLKRSVSRKKLLQVKFNQPLKRLLQVSLPFELLISECLSSQLENSYSRVMRFKFLLNWKVKHDVSLNKAVSI